MIKGQDFVVFSDDWGRHPFSCQHIMKWFLPYNRIVWVNTIGMRPPKLSVYDVVRSFEKVVGWVIPQSNKRQALPENLWVISPASVPYNMVPAIRWMNAKIGLAQVHAEMKQRQFHDPIVITTLPNTVDFIGALGEVASVYYCVDEFTAYPDLPTKMIADMENELLGKVDLVITTAHELQRRKHNGRRDTLLVPHGVDVDHYKMVRKKGHTAPTIMKNISHPIVGFFGVISEWVDLKLIDRMAELQPKWSWVFIGPAQTNVEWLQKRSNIYMLGRIDYQELPRYAAQFDVGIIPFVVNDLTMNVNPLKLLEYFACGLPVVSTPLPEVMRYGSVVSIADTAEQFAAAIDHALTTNSAEDIHERLLVAARASWESRAEEFSHCLETLKVLRGHDA